MVFLSSAAFMDVVRIKVKAYMRAFAPKKRDKTPWAGSGFLRCLRNLTGWWKCPQALQWPHRESHSFIQTCSEEDSIRNGRMAHLSTRGGVLGAPGRPETRKRGLKQPWANLEELGSQAALAHHTRAPVDFIPDRFKFKQNKRGRCQKTSLQQTPQAGLQVHSLLGNKEKELP